MSKQCEFLPNGFCPKPAVMIFYNRKGDDGDRLCQNHYDIMMRACDSLGRGEGKPDWWEMWKLNA